MASWLCFQPAPVICERLVYEKTAIFTAYTLSKDETDGSPCIGAGNHNLCEERKKNPDITIVASFSIPLHTNLYIEGFGSAVVLDRMPEKNKGIIDILFPDKKSALKFGRRKLKYWEIK